MGLGVGLIAGALRPRPQLVQQRPLLRRQRHRAARGFLDGFGVCVLDFPVVGVVLVGLQDGLVQDALGHRVRFRGPCFGQRCDVLFECGRECRR